MIAAAAPRPTAFTLKVAAIVGMTCNHVANIFAATMPAALTIFLYTFGGLTFPIMAFLLCEGYRHTSNLRRYAARLALFAVLSQVPYSLLWGATANVLFTLLIGLGLLWADDHLRSRAAAVALVAVAALLTVECDWGGIGPVMIYLFHRLHENPRGVLITMLVAVLALGLPTASLFVEALTEVGSPGREASLLEQAGVESPVASLEQGGSEGGGATFTVLDAGSLVASAGALGYYTIGFALATLLMTTYNGLRGRPLKWFFYLYYPAHLLVLWGFATFV